MVKPRKVLIYGVALTLGVVGLFTYLVWPEFPDERLLSEIQNNVHVVSTRKILVPRPDIIDPSAPGSRRWEARLMAEFVFPKHDAKLRRVATSINGDLIGPNDAAYSYLQELERRKLVQLELHLDEGRGFVIYRGTKLQRFEGWFESIFPRGSNEYWDPMQGQTVKGSPPPAPALPGP